MSCWCTTWSSKLSFAGMSFEMPLRTWSFGIVSNVARISLGVCAFPYPTDSSADAFGTLNAWRPTLATIVSIGVV